MEKIEKYFSLYIHIVQFAGGLGFVETYVCYFQLLLAPERILILCSISIIFMEDVMPPGQEKKICCRNAQFLGVQR